MGQVHPRGKGQGGGRPRLTEGQNGGRLRPAQELRAALRAGDQLVLHYQPRVDLRTGAVLGVEALSRWRHPERGLLLPEEFIPLADEHGLMPELTIAVLERALGQQRAWRRAGLSLEVAVNVAGANLLDPGFPGQVGALLEGRDPADGGLALEITERAALAGSELALDVLSRLERLGIGLCLDDFGIGHSSLAQLRLLPVRQLKIDRSFVLEMLSDREAAAIVRFTVDLGRELDLHVVAEGVETPAQWERLVELGCHSAQGFYLSRPVTPAPLAGWLEARERRAAPPPRPRVDPASDSMLEALMEAAAAVLAADSLEDTFGRIARHLRILVPHHDLVVYEVSECGGRLEPVFARGNWSEEVMAESFPIGDGITGAALNERRTRNVPRTDLDPLSKMVPGTEVEPEALVSVPLLVEERAVGALNVYRVGEDVAFSAAEAEVIERFAAMAALAFHSARQRETLRAQARTDGLTGLLNHRACHERLQAEVARTLQNGRPLSVVVLDLDHFKGINDTHGHAEGDRALRLVAERLRGAVRADDAVARLGGEEFALILPGAGRDEADEAAERARAAVAGITIGDRGLTASAGIAACPEDSQAAGRLLELADAALYRAKRSGRDRTHRHAAPSAA